ncbi:MAG TPA: TIGR01777 family protein [Planctomycetaceae bacterium]|nr:TIGR01777 family protein [Planctomycetaceae bacterium]
MSRTFELTSHFNCNRTFLFDWHDQPGAFERLVPPWKSVKVVESDLSISDNSQTKFSVGVGPLKIRWVAIHSGYTYPTQFIDVQKSGPFRSWEHKHLFSCCGDESKLTDAVTYRLPAGILGKLLLSRTIEEDIKQMFEFRHNRTKNDLSRLAAFSGRKLKVAISGSSGMIGNELKSFLQGGGHKVIRVTRTQSSNPEEAYWDSPNGKLDTSKLEDLDAFVHLAGENIAGKRWSKKQKQRLYDSRVAGTRSIADALSKCEHPPKVFICASATGIYGSTGRDITNEDCLEQPDTFLANLCRDWEQACDPLANHSRIVNARFGIVLSPKGGALKNMLMPFKAGLGGRIGNGQQLWSWISLDDAVYSIARLIRDDSFNGPVNIVSPQVVSNSEFTKSLGAALSRPTLLPMPGFVTRIVFGEMADALLLCSCGVKPSRLEEAGFEFAYPSLDELLLAYLGRSTAKGKALSECTQ